MMTGIAAGFVDAVQCRTRVSGLTHNFYRYPARFSPIFVRAAIETFTERGDTVLDPFMGGGTTLVEACALGRRAIGTDINSLSVFVTKAKTTLLSEHDMKEVQAWAEVVAEQTNLHKPVERDSAWAEMGYHRNISSRRTWPIRKMLEMALATLDQLLSTEYQRRFARCALLRTAQWALDCRKDIPPARLFRKQLLQHVSEMVVGASEFAEAVSTLNGNARRELATCLHRSAAGLESERSLTELGPAKLIVTSPPYPGIHVLYHRWQVQGRKETPAPYWIADSRDGDGASFYTFGYRRQPGLADYYATASSAFSSIARVITRETAVVQMIAFSEPSWQLPLYLEMMEEAGYVEVLFRSWANSADGRLWRRIPNRKFYADQMGDTTSSKEVVLFHRLMK